MAVEFGGADAVELHKTSMVEGRMRMRQVDHINVPANGAANLKPGGYHIMLIGIKKEMQPDAEEVLVLSFSDGSKKTIKARVKPMSEMHQ